MAGLVAAFFCLNLIIRIQAFAFLGVYVVILLPVVSCIVLLLLLMLLGAFTDLIWLIHLIIRHIEPFVRNLFHRVPMADEGQVHWPASFRCL